MPDPLSADGSGIGTRSDAKRDHRPLRICALEDRCLMAGDASSSNSVWIIDDGDAAFSTIGQWESLADDASFSGDALLSGASDSERMAVWEFTELAPGQYRLATTWRESVGRSPNAPFAVLENGELLSTTIVNQRVAADSFEADGILWEQLGNLHVISGGTLMVRLSNLGLGTFMADAMRLERVADLPAGPEIQVTSGVDIADGAGVISFNSPWLDGTIVGHPVTREFTVRNVGQAELQLSEQIQVPAGFTLVSGFGTTRLGFNERTTFTVRRGAASPGLMQGQLQFQTNDADESTFNFTVRGSVVSRARPLIDLETPEDVEQLRADLIQHFWRDEGFPVDKLPQSVDRDIVSPLSDLPNLASVDLVHIVMDWGFTSEVYHFQAAQSNGKLVVVHQGHAFSFAESGLDTAIHSLLQEGYSVLAFFMPLYGPNTGPVTGYHEGMKSLDSSVHNPIKFFVEPLAIGLNYVRQEFDYHPAISMVGVSGGGWTTTMYAAIDPTIQTSFSVAGTMPLHLLPTTAGDYEFRDPATYEIANYLELYLLGSYGENRKQVQIFNRFDPANFYGEAYLSFEETIQRQLTRLGAGGFEAFADESHQEHQVTLTVMEQVILPELARQYAQDDGSAEVLEEESGAATLPVDRVIVLGSDAGAAPRVQLLDAQTGAVLLDFLAFDASFRGGVRLASGDVNRDGIVDVIAAAGVGGSPHVRVFSGVDGSVLNEFYAYNLGFLGGVFVAAGDVNGDGFCDIITSAGAGGGPHIRIVSGVDLAPLADFFAYNAGFLGGVQVAAADLNGDGFVDVITGAGAGGGPHVRAFSLVDGAVLFDFYAYSAMFQGGVFVAGGDINGDQRADIITGTGAGGGPHVRAFSGTNNALLADFFAYDPQLRGGVRVAASDPISDHHAAILTLGGQGEPANLRVFERIADGSLIMLDDRITDFTHGAFLSAGLADYTGGAVLKTSLPQVPEHGTPSLTVAELDLFLHGPTAARLPGRADAFEIRLADLPYGYLATTIAGIIYLDRDAAGNGWFADPSPADDDEFAWDDAGMLAAIANSEAEGRIDLLSVLEHQIRALYGLTYPSLAESAVTAAVDALAPGQRTAAAVS